jgi:hypothetical protein
MHMSNGKEKRMVDDTGYKIVHSVSIGGTEIVCAVNMNAPDGNHYILAACATQDFLPDYEICLKSSNYLEVMGEFAVRINAQIDKVYAEIGMSDYQAELITAKQCCLDDLCQNIAGKAVVIKAEALPPEYRRGDRQLVLVNGGLGAIGSLFGKNMMCRCLHDGRHVRFNRQDVLGEMKSLPDWAKTHLEEIKKEQKYSFLPVRFAGNQRRYDPDRALRAMPLPPKEKHYER